jgi:DNA-directed RNA polymerase sigma subunit (sigma70/sigma32)
LVVPWRRNLPTQVFQSIQEEGDKSLREVGKELGVSYESVRQARFDLMQKGSL